ncbi:MAG TPA: NAD(P)/FAD-dependent oxidoreductase [Jatrophihabitans sp.]|jgi:phytoene dehydrogenase-like protein|uniref:phytoene desaturase family protein n=1 Tax=Jatrophihabitans sp. TaxID=1932789 RepID=UPI002DF932EA|nr:NAD(P)/FAD-dependent oxidoreductase [Jatrophihabitans sp.]
MPTAVIIGAGHNGLVGANLLADAGWDVLVLESQARVGGAAFSDRSVHPDFVTDWYSAFYPFGVASPVLAELDLGSHGLNWTHAPSVLAHVFPDDRCAVLSRDLDTTAASLDGFAAGDGDVWRGLHRQFEDLREPLLDALLRPFPPVRAGLRLARALGTAELVRFARFAVQSVRRAGDELFRGEGAPILLAGNALHTDLAPEAATSAVYGWLLVMLGQSVGFPVPEGGSGRITEALASRLVAAGGSIRTGATAARLDVHDGRVRAVVLDDGERLAADTVLADVSAPFLYGSLIAAQHLPRRLLEDIDRFQWDSPTLKIDWALDRPLGWTASEARGAGTVHLGVDLDGLTRFAGDLATRTVPERPFVLLGQMTTADPTRSPAGTESAWGYTHLPEGIDWTQDLVDEHVGRVEGLIERHAPGFGASVSARRVLGPSALQDSDANLVGGAVGGGTASIHQQLIFRPVPGLARAETPIDGVYLASASAHPGGGVHGAPGANAAAAALARARLTGRLKRAAIDTLLGRIYADPDSTPHRQLRKPT